MRNTTSTRGNRASWRTCLLVALICALCTWATTSCSTGTKATRADLPQAAPPAPPPGPQANQRRRCPTELPPARSDLVPDLLANHDEAAALYHECQARANSLIDSVGEWERTALSWYCGALDRMGLADARCSAPRK